MEKIKLRILISADPEIPVPPPLYGGIERIIDSLVRGLIERGHEVALVANPNSSLKINSLYSWPGENSRGVLNHIKNINYLRKIIKEFRPDIVHSYSRLLYLSTILPSKLPKIMSYQRFPSSNTIINALRISRKSLNFTGCSNYIVNLGIKGGGNWQTIYNFVELDKYDFNPFVNKNAPLVFLSRVEEIKGAHLAIKAAIQTNSRLIIAGNTDKNSYYWKNEIEPYIGKDGIEYIGPVNDMQKNELLGNAKTLVVPVQWDEPFGIVFAESLACGTPVISCPRGALTEIVREGIDGYLVNDLKELCNAINNIDKINRKDCRERVEKNFSDEVIVRKYENLYKSFLN